MPNDEQVEDDFGFSSTLSAIEKIKGIKPSTLRPLADIDAIDAVAENAGFISRESGTAPQPTALYRPVEVEPSAPVSMRVRMSVWKAFKLFCRENRYSYPEGLEELMKRAGLVRSQGSA